MKPLRTLTAALATSLAALSGAAPASAVESEYWQYIFDARVTAMETLIANFEAANPDITVRQSTFPYADYRTKVAAAIPSGEGPDVVQLFYGWLNDQGQDSFLFHSQNNTVAARATADRNTFGHLS